MTTKHVVDLPFNLSLLGIGVSIGVDVKWFRIGLEVDGVVCWSGRREVCRSLKKVGVFGEEGTKGRGCGR